MRRSRFLGALLGITLAGAACSTQDRVDRHRQAASDDYRRAQDELRKGQDHARKELLDARDKAAEKLANAHDEERKAAELRADRVRQDDHRAVPRSDDRAFDRSLERNDRMAERSGGHSDTLGTAPWRARDRRAAEDRERYPVAGRADGKDYSNGTTLTRDTHSGERGLRTVDVSFGSKLREKLGDDWYVEPRPSGVVATRVHPKRADEHLLSKVNDKLRSLDGERKDLSAVYRGGEVSVRGSVRDCDDAVRRVDDFAAIDGVNRIVARVRCDAR